MKKLIGFSLTSAIIISGLGISNTTPIYASEIQPISKFQSLREDTIKDGIGGRAFLNSTGSILTTKVVLPEIKQNGTLKVSGDGTLFIYSGFSGKIESDIGFQYSIEHNVWKPYMKVGSRGNNQVDYLEGELDFTYKNGFKPGSEVQLTIYKNLNGSTRATYWGTSNKGFTGRLISEMKNTNINSVDKWKALSTIAVPTKDKNGNPLSSTVIEESVKNIRVKDSYNTTFKDIRIDNQPINPVIHATKFANMNNNSNNITIEITKK
ncbi:YrpD family protein [Bacillus thuringiensis]|uniref:YrpD family protein n=1 Tax=Bacillus thuringiensis TaxID=1428 RepID=UPI001298C313|nr:YrpD family protein [Bacillus thuringiensis]MEB8931503.1 YrpD family protein [Bacillus cereus]MCR6790230.1 hypothetical protein [Bacillus thuringiensis]MCR6820705.1 hypothetical protein [Bacillus thuringiensis]MCR6831900.1 hypothetical protein [Bacillus thuringiensis]MEB9915167.1 YrpD family protein [Bacillus cereus]